MNIQKITEAIGNIDDKYLNEAELPQRRHFRFKPTLLAAIIAIIALSTSAAALSYTDYAAVYKKASNTLVRYFHPQDFNDNTKEPPADTGNSALDQEEEITESAVAISYISSTSGLENLQYSIERLAGFATESPFDEEETHPGFADLTPTNRDSGDYDYYYREFGEKIPNPEEFPWLESFEEYGIEIENEGEFMTGDFRVTSVMCDNHYFYATVQYALPEKAKKAVEEILVDIPENAKFGFSECWIEPRAAYMSVVPISLDGDVFTFMAYSQGFRSLPDEVKISLKNFGFGYYSAETNWRWKFVTLYETKERITIPSDNFKKMPSRVSNTVAYSSEPDDVQITAVLSPFGITFQTTSESQNGAKAIVQDKYIFVNKLRIHLDDGRIYGSGKTYFALRYILHGKSGFAENIDDDDPANDIYYTCLPFANAVDIDKIEKLSVDGHEFVFGD